METPGSLRHLNEGQLLTRIAAGHTLAVFELVRRYDQVLILPVAYRVLRNWADAEDVYSELVVRLLALSMTRDLKEQVGWPPEHFPTWLMTAVRRLALDMKRSRDAEWERRAHQKAWLDGVLTPEEECELRDLVRWVGEGLDSLPSVEREALQLLVCRDLPVKVACVAAGVSKATLCRRRDRALARLRQSERLRRLFQDALQTR